MTRKTKIATVQLCSLNTYPFIYVTSPHS